MSHPLEYFKPDFQKKSFIFLLILTILIMVIMNVIGAPLISPTAPNGIVSFELAFTPARAQQMIDSWGIDAQLRGAFIQGLDFLFPLVYSIALGLGCLLTSRVLRSRGKPLSRLGVFIAWGLIIAALCDYIENIALTAELFGKVQSPFPQIAGVCAVIKFTSILVAIAYIIFGLVMRLVSRTNVQSAT
jgi:hypothetical protein